MNTTKIFDGILNLVFFFLGDKVKGLSPVILNISAVILGLMTWVTADGGLFEFLCDQGANISFLLMFCNPETLPIYPIMITVIALLNIFSRRFAELQARENNSNAPAHLKVGNYDTGTSTLVDGMIMMALIFVALVAIFTGDFVPLLLVVGIVVVPMIVFTLISSTGRSI